MNKFWLLPFTIIMVFFVLFLYTLVGWWSYLGIIPLLGLWMHVYGEKQ